ncbi:MAG: hypothetical protein QXL96_05080 [Ignisphaera sp.]
MDKVLILRVAKEGIATSFSKLIQGVFTGVYVVLLYNGEQRYHVEKLASMASDIVAININCENSLKIKEIQALSLPQKLYILDFCFSCCRDYYKNKNTLCLPPYITLARILVTRVKTIFETLTELKVRIQLSRQELDQLANILNIKTNQVNQCISTCLTTEEENYYSITLNAEDTNITVTAIGNTMGSKEKKQLSIQYIIREQPKQVISSFLAQIISILALWFYREYLDKDVDIVTKIGYEEGLYTLYISKLIEYGADFLNTITLLK